MNVILSVCSLPLPTPSSPPSHPIPIASSNTCHHNRWIRHLIYTTTQFTMVPNENTIICFRCVDAMRVNQKPFLLLLFFFICVSLFASSRTFPSHIIRPARFHFVPLCLRVHAIETSCNLIVLLSYNPFAAYYKRFFRKQRTCNYLFRRHRLHTFTSSISNSIHMHTPSSDTNNIACNLLEEPRRVLIDGGNSNHHHHQQI